MPGLPTRGEDLKFGALGVAGVSKTQLSFQRQRTQTGIGVTDEVGREKPGSRRQLGVLHQATCRFANIEV